MTSEYANTPKIPLNIVKHIHPDNKDDFRAMATPKNVRKEGKALVNFICAVCTKKEGDGVKLLTCARCKNSWYCSKECQKKHWPTHKPLCQKAEAPTKKLLSNLIADSLLMFHIQTALVLQYNLNKNPRPDTPLSAFCDLSIVPSDSTYWIKLTTGNIPAEELERGTEGMLQVNGIVELDPAATLDDTRMKMWRMTRDALKAEGRGHEHVVVVYFQFPNAPEGLGNAMSVLIPQLAIERVNSGEGFERKSAIFGSVNLALSVGSCLEFINTHIRSDKRNQLHLRIHMSKEDIDKAIKKIRSENKDT